MPLRFALTILLFPAAGLLGACGPNGDASQATGTDPEAARPDTSMIRDVSPEQTLGLLADGVAAASPSLAIQTLDQWIERIDSAQVEGAEADSLAALSDDLTRLRNLLQSSPLDGHGRWRRERHAPAAFHGRRRHVGSTVG